MKKFENVQSIEAKVVFHGNGLINADNKDQKWYLISHNLIDGKVNDNIKYAKKVFYTDKDGKSSFRYKISSDCLRHSMFEKEMAYFNTGLATVPYALYNAIATPEMIARGYVFTENDSMKKTSMFNITSAIADMTPETKVYADFCSRAGNRPSKDIEDEDAKGGTSVHSVENVGEYNYVSHMYIDLCEGQFVSMDNLYDRCAVSFEKSGMAFKKIYFDSLKRNFGVDFEPEIKNYRLETAVMGDEFAEEGFKLSKEMVNKMACSLLKRVANVNIRRNANGGQLNFVSMVVKVNMKDGKTEEFTVNNETDLDNVSFDYADVYVEADAEAVRRRIELMKLAEEEEKKTKKAKKNTKKNEDKE